jgi:transcriptional regulator with XRE-family HTH domain
MLYDTRLLRQLRRTIGQNISRYRHQQHLPLSKLAEMTGIREIMLDRFELGKYQIRLDDMLKIACALDVPVVEFMQ